MSPPHTAPHIRTANAADVARLAEFNCAMALETEGLVLNPVIVRAGVARLIANPALGCYRVAECGGKVVACVLVTTEWSDWHNCHYWWIQSVYVSPAHRRQGVFRALYQAVLAAARTNGEVASLRLYVEQDNQRAQFTYQQLGMTPSHYRVFEQKLQP